MRMLSVALGLGILLAGCSNVHVNRATLVASTAALACDWMQTRAAAARGWRIGALPQRERNPVLGPSPSTETVDLYFSTSIVLNTALWLVLPRRWKSLIPGVIIGAQAMAIQDNLESRSEWMQVASERATEMRGLCRM